MKIRETLLSLGNLHLELMVNSPRPFTYKKGTGFFNVSSFIGFSITKEDENGKWTSQSLYTSYYDKTLLTKVINDVIKEARREDYMEEVYIDDQLSYRLSPGVKKSFKFRSTNGKIIGFRLAIKRVEDTFLPCVKIVINDLNYDTLLDIDRFETFCQIYNNSDLHVLSHNLYQSYMTNMLVNEKERKAYLAEEDVEEENNAGS